MERVKKVWCAVVVLVVTFLSSCTMDSERLSLGCWVSMEQTGASAAKVRVRLEDASGNVPTGARVLLETPAAALSWLYFDNETNMYETSLTSPISGDYTVSVRSTLGNVESVVPYVSLSATPTVQTLQDAEGTTAGGNKSLKSSLAISASWQAIAGATAYQVAVMQGASTIVIVSTTGTSYVFPPGTFTSGKTYALRVEAQYIAGDPYLRDKDYYAFSYSDSPDYYFTTE